MNRQQREAQELELLLQNNSYIELLGLLPIYQGQANFSGMELDALKFRILQKTAEDFASTANDERTKKDFMQVASSARIYRTTLQLLQARNTTESTSSPSN